MFVTHSPNGKFQIAVQFSTVSLAVEKLTENEPVSNGSNSVLHYRSQNSRNNDYNNTRYLNNNYRNRGNEHRQNNYRRNERYQRQYQNNLTLPYLNLK